MDKTQKKLTSEQGDLFQQVVDHTPAHLSDNAPDLDIEMELMGAVQFALREAKKYGLSRERVVDRMNQCLPEHDRITKRQLDGWCAKSAEHRPFPAKYLPAFCWAVRGVIAPVEVITRALGLHVIDAQEYAATELGKTVLDKTRLTQRERQLKNILGAV